MTTPTDDRALLDAIADALDDAAPVSAMLARDPDSRLRRYPVPLLHRYGVYAIDYQGPDHDDLVYLGYAPGEPVIRLTGRPDRFGALLRADGARIERTEDAVAAARAFVETTRDMRDLVYLVASVDELRLLPATDAERHAAIEQCRATLRELIAPPRVVAGGPPFHVELFVVREQTLERHVLAIAEDGDIEDEPEVVARDLPLVFSR